MDINKINEELKIAINELSDETIKSYLAGREAQLNQAKQDYDDAYQAEWDARDNRYEKEHVYKKVSRKNGEAKEIARKALARNAKQTFADWFGKDLTGETYDGDLDISAPELYSLKGCPKVVNGDFCINSHLLTSFEYAPEVVNGRFYVRDSGKIKDLTGCPKEVTGDFDIYDPSEIVSLKGAPEKVGGRFYFGSGEYHRLKLKSLEGAPKEVGGNFDITFTELESLKGAPEKVGGIFDVRDCKITSLEGCPKYIGGDLDVSETNIKSLEGCPEEIGGDLYVEHTKLKDFKGAPKLIGRNVQAKSIPSLKSIEGLEKVEGTVYCKFADRWGSKLDEVKRRIADKDKE